MSKTAGWVANIVDPDPDFTDYVVSSEFTVFAQAYLFDQHYYSYGQ